jgi:hypothetical protein
VILTRCLFEHTHSDESELLSFSRNVLAKVGNHKYKQGNFEGGLQDSASQWNCVYSETGSSFK